ncbi:hypothetical protein FIE12Z_1508 [Fusarium flagelliforme]|uniref:Uncharacterized protein n=1 Tax=Fusarium flagelliforme TaxID=2675880 RepID=A0A395N2R1_9HYPO|nr:hypothetical protein FIE12Z_1508 [Fusarium flagelliforme]
MSPRENEKTSLASDEIMLLPYQKSQDHATTGSKHSVPIPAPGNGNGTSLVTSATSKCPAQPDFWATYRSKPWNMCLLVALGTAFALGHHLLYFALDGREAVNQSLMLRYGTILAFCAKASLGTAAAMAFQQRAWRVLRYKMARLETVDSIFTANSDIFSLLTWSSIRKTKIGSLIAVYCWITPLVVVLTSETLSVLGEMKENNGTCPNIRTLNFSNEKWVYWRDPMVIQKQFLTTVSFWNTTSPNEDIDKDDAEQFDYWTAVSQQWNDMIAMRVGLAKEPLVRKESGPEICSKGWNCSYVLNIVAPGYKCEEVASGINSKVRNLGDAIPPFNTSMLAPMGNMTYYARNDIGEYGNPQIISAPGGRPKQKPPFPKNLGAFRTEPIMWIGYCTVDDYSKPQPSVPGQGGWYEAYTPVIIGCEHYEVNYTVQFDWVGEAQSHKVLQREYVRKVVNTTWTSELDPEKRLKDRTTAVPEENYVLPKDIEEYRLTAAYHSLGYSLRNLLNGTTTMPHFNVNSKILVTPLVDRINYLPPRDFGRAIRGMYENMVISLLSSPSFNVVSWASTGRPTGIAKTDPSSKGYPCRKARYMNVFRYDKAQLLSVYAASIALAIAAVFLGLHAYWEEGTMRDMKPSSIIEASRASHLHALGNTSEVKIGYGIVHEEAGRSIRSFGVEGNLTQPERARDP